MFFALSSFLLRNIPDFVWSYYLSKHSVGGISLTSFRICLGSVCIFPLALGAGGLEDDGIHSDFSYSLGER